MTESNDEATRKEASKLLQEFCKHNLQPLIELITNLSVSMDKNISNGTHKALGAVISSICMCLLEEFKVTFISGFTVIEMIYEAQMCCMVNSLNPDKIETVRNIIKKHSDSIKTEMLELLAIEIGLTDPILRQQTIDVLKKLKRAHDANRTKS